MLWPSHGIHLRQRIKMRHLSVDLEGGWAFPLERLAPNAALTSRLATDSHWANEIKAICEEYGVPVVFAVVLNALDIEEIEKKVEAYQCYWGKENSELARKLYDLRNIQKAFENASVASARLGVHSLDHSIMEDMTERQFHALMGRAGKAVQAGAFLKYFVFPQNVQPEGFASFQLPEGWIFRCSHMTNPRKTGVRSMRYMRFLRSDSVVESTSNTIYKTESYFPLGDTYRASALRLLCRFRLRLGLSKFPWTHAWELEGGVSKDVLAAYMREFSAVSRKT